MGRGYLLVVSQCRIPSAEPVLNIVLQCFFNLFVKMRAVNSRAFLVTPE